MSNGQALNQQFITKFSQDLLAFLRHRPDVNLESLAHSTPEMSFDLGKVRKNQLIHNRAGDRIFVMNLTGVAYIRFNSITGSKYRLRVGSISTPFQKLYLENEAQAGKSTSIIIGYGAFIDFATAYASTKLLKPDDSEVNPASEDKQDSLLARLDLKPSESTGAIRDTKIIDETDKVVSSGVTYEFAAVTGIGTIINVFVLSPSTSFSVILTINGIDLLDRTYAQYLTISDNLSGIAAFPERDSDGVLTGKYLVCLKDIHFKNHISIKVKNNSGGNITFNNLFCKHKVV